jgi:hypothetical protein
MCAGERDHGFRDGGMADIHHLRAEFFSQVQILLNAQAIFRRHMQVTWRFNKYNIPFCLEINGQPPACAYQTLTQRVGTQAYQNSVASRPGARDRLRLHIADHLAVDPLCGSAQGEFAQSGKISFSEKLFHST